MGLPRPDAGTPVHDYLAQHWSRKVILNWPCLKGEPPDPDGADATVRRRLLAPRANAICEPMTGTLRRELSGQLPIITEHLCRFNTSIRPVAWGLADDVRPRLGTR